MHTDTEKRYHQRLLKVKRTRLGPTNFFKNVKGGRYCVRSKPRPLAVKQLAKRNCFGRITGRFADLREARRFAGPSGIWVIIDSTTGKVVA